MGSMRPLLEEEARAGDGGASDGEASSRNAWALGLLEVGDHYQVDPVQRQRVWFRLSRGPARRAMPIRRVAMATSVALGMVGGTAIASAALGHWPEWAVRAYERLAPWSSPPAPSSVSVHPAAPARTHRGGHRSQAQLASGAQAQERGTTDTAETNGLAPSPAPAAAPLVVAPTIGPVSGAAPAGSDASRENTQRRESPVGARAPRHLSQMPASEDDRPVLAAMRSLRRDKNPVRARTLLRKYLAEHPNGTLAEEALALSIETAVAHGDTDAKVLAGRYLQIYPTGPFRSLAEQTLSVRQ